MRSIYDTRRENLRSIIRDRFDGSQVKFASAMEYERSMVSRLLSEKAGTRQNIGSRMARFIESRLSLADNWLDAEHPQNVARQAEATYGDGALNLEALTDAIALVERYLDARQETLAPRDKASVVAYVYDHCLSEGKPDERVIRRAVRLRLVA